MGKILAKEFGLDEKFVSKKPSDGLTGKSDEENFGFSYEELDKDTPVCYDFVDNIGYLQKSFKKRCTTYRKNECFFIGGNDD